MHKIKVALCNAIKYNTNFTQARQHYSKEIIIAEFVQLINACIQNVINIKKHVLWKKITTTVAKYTQQLTQERLAQVQLTQVIHIYNTLPQICTGANKIVNTLINNLKLHKAAYIHYVAL